MTAAIVLVPFAGLAVAVVLLWGHGIGLADVLLGLLFYVISGLGVTVGFHRCFTHRSFTAKPASAHGPGPGRVDRASRAT